jgi:hypothetical protein
MSTMEYTGPMPIDWVIFLKGIQEEKNGLVGFLIAAGVNLLLLAFPMSIDVNAPFSLYQQLICSLSLLVILVYLFKARFAFSRAFPAGNWKSTARACLVILLPAMIFTSAIALASAGQLIQQFTTQNIGPISQSLSEWYFRWNGLIVIYLSLATTLLLFCGLILQIKRSIRFALFSRQIKRMAWWVGCSFLLNLPSFCLIAISQNGLSFEEGTAFCCLSFLWLGFFQIIFLWQYWRLIRVVELFGKAQAKKQLRAGKPNEHD